MIDRDGCLTGVIVPFFQSLIVGLLTGLTVLGFVLWLVNTDPRWLGLTVFAGAALWTYTGHLQMWRREAYPQIATYPAEVQTVEPDPITPIHIHMGSQIKSVDLPCTPAELHEFVDGLLSNRPFTEKEWTGKGNLFSKSEFSKLRKVFIDRGWAYWRSGEDNPSQGCSLSPPGRIACRQIIQELQA